MSNTEETTAVATPDEQRTALKKELAAIEPGVVDKVCASVCKTFVRIQSIQADSNRKSIPLYWQIGHELATTLKWKKEAPRDRVISKFAVIVGTSATNVRRALLLATKYTEDRMKHLAENGFHMGHIEHLVTVDDYDTRRKLEVRVEKEGLTTRETKALVAEEVKKDDSILSEGSRKRQKGAQASKAQDAENPLKAVPLVSKRLEALVESTGTLYLALDNLTNLPLDAALQVLPDLKELNALVEGNQPLLVEIGKACAGKLKLLESAKKKA